jgi:hypothetical protein
MGGRVSNGGQCEIQHCSMAASYWRMPASNAPPPLLATKSMAPITTSVNAPAPATPSRRPSIVSVSSTIGASTPVAAGTASTIASTTGVASRSRSGSESKFVESDDTNVRRVLIAGAASVGKSTLTKQLSRLLGNTNTMASMEVAVIRSHIMLVFKTLAMLAMGHDNPKVEVSTLSLPLFCQLITQIAFCLCYV